MKNNHPKTIQELLAIKELPDWKLQIPTRGYLFHGSPNGDIKTLEPRQAISYGELDGKPAVCAASNLYDSMFLALFNRNRLPDPSSGKSGWSHTHDQPHYFATRNLIEAARKATGFVYLLDTSGFNWVHLGESDKGPRREIRSLNPVLPIARLEVTYEDFIHPVEEVKL